MGGHGMGMNHGDMMMSMYFHLGYKETILFSFWTIDSLGGRSYDSSSQDLAFGASWLSRSACIKNLISGLIGSMVGIFLASMLYEGLKVFREFLLQRTLVCERSHNGTSQHHSANNGLRVPLATEHVETPDGSAMMTPPVKTTFMR